MRPSESERLASWSDSLAARFIRRAGHGSAPLRPGQPRSIGSLQRGQDLLAGHYRIGGQLVAAPARLLWDALPGSSRAVREAHGFSWLDDLAAVPTPEAEALAREWVGAWIDRFGGGHGQGWTPELAGSRALRLVHYAEMLGAPTLAPCVDRHLAFLLRRAPHAPAGWPKVAAFAGLVHAAFALSSGDTADDALRQLGGAAGDMIGREGGVPSRNPEALARVLLLLGWTVETALAHRRTPGQALLGATARGTPVLRGLVQPDGRLPRFHGGGAAQGVADAALALTGRRRVAAPATLAMGFARMRHGGASVVLDAAAPPDAPDTAHASTLAAEITVGGQPLVVNCGTGIRFGDRWGRAARATASHSTLSLDGFSSSRFGRDGHSLIETPDRVRVERKDTEGGTALIAGHDGYVGTHGLWHERILEMSRDGRQVEGEDALIAADGAARRRFDRARRSGPVRFAVRFHLDPAVEPSLDMGGRAVSLLLPCGALWVFRAASRDVRLALEPSVYFPSEGLEPLATRQIVLFSSADEYATRIMWHLAAVRGAAPSQCDTGM